jgi:methionine-S-sulfoxide reductase
MNYEKIILGTGCFWCTEALFRTLEGVNKVIPGYCGGTEEKVSYEEVCTGHTEFIEVVELYYDSNVLKLNDIVNFFLKIHDPTTFERQGNDVGKQYSSVIFYKDEKTKNVIEQLIVKNQIKYKNKIVTKILKEKNFVVAENAHQNFYMTNENHPYCQFVIKPKLKKMENK